MTPSEGAPGIRARVRAQMTDEILNSAREQLASEGADGLSLRAISRELGMSSSAIYRYFRSRDELLTQLIVDAYNAVGAAAEAAEARVPREALAARFLATCRAVRDWATTHRHEYALIFGSPVPGYAAPQDTIAPATRIPVVLIGILLDAPKDEVPDPPPAVQESMAPLLATIAEMTGQDGADGDAEAQTFGLPVGLIARGLIAWTHLIGAVSFELFGHRHNVIGASNTDKETFFDYEIETMIQLVGLSTP